MKKYLKLFSIALLLLTLSGCTFEREHSHEDEHILTPEEVLEIELKEKREILKEKIKQASFCETADDCTVIEGKCPVGCYVGVNASKVDEIQSAIGEHEDSCSYRCRIYKGVECQENQCKVVF